MKTHIQELVEAVEAIERVLVDLDLSKSKCPACGRPQANNWEDTKMHMALSAAKKRIDSSIVELLADDENDSALRVSEC